MPCSVLSGFYHVYERLRVDERITFRFVNRGGCIVDEYSLTK